MKTIHDLTIIPKQQVLNSVAAFDIKFDANSTELTVVLTKIKTTISESKFMQGQNHSVWMSTRGADFIANPKLFACAPLTYVCAFLGELFNNFDVEEIQKIASQEVIQQALVRLNEFQLH